MEMQKNLAKAAYDPELDDLTDEEMTQRFRLAVRMADLEKRLKKQPVAIYDEKLDKAFLEYPDGRRVYAN